MYNLSRGEKNQSETTSPNLEDSKTFSDDINPDIDVDVDIKPGATKIQQFLDYAAFPPPDFGEHFDRVMNMGNSTTSQSSNVITCAVLPPDFVQHFDRAMKLENSTSQSDCGEDSGEQLILNIKCENAGEICDYDLAASGYTKKEFTQDDNTLNITSTTNVRKPLKHFFDENPIPQDFILNHHQLREYRSLDRNFKRHNEQRMALDSHTNLPGFRSSRERFKDIPAVTPLPKGSAWTQSFDRRYDRRKLSEDKLVVSNVECVYSLLSMLGSKDNLEISKTFHELSKTPETCNTLRGSGCVPLLVQMIHDEEGGTDKQRKYAGMALHNVVHTHPDEKTGRREAKVLRLLDQIIDYCKFLRSLLQSGGEAIADDADRHPLAAMSSLMKVSFDREHRHTMCELGALLAIPNLVHLDHAVHGPKPENQCCNSLRRFALMTLTNLTFGDEKNKSLLCSQKLFMEALVGQLYSAPDDLLQVTASVLRNLSWRADAQMKAVLNEIGTVTALAKAAMKNKCENTLKAILSALWNLSAHCSTNKAEFCAVEGAISFIVCMLTDKGSSKTLKNIENAGGILRNVSSHIAVSEEYRQILREHNCLSILLQQLKSESQTVVSNSCGTLWNLSARCPQDQQFLWDNGAVPMLISLINSKHAMISEGSACALKNLLNFRPSSQNTNHIDNIARSLNLKNVRKQKALEQELGAASKSHSETCDKLDSINPKDKTTYDASTTMESAIQRPRFPLHDASGSVVAAGATERLTRSALFTKSESRDSVFSAKSDGGVYYHLMRSSSASDVNRKSHNNSRIPAPTTYSLEKDVEQVDEQPIDYSRKYILEIIKPSAHREDEKKCSATYQETDLDQPTDFSLRYAENQLGREVKNIPLNSQVNMAAVAQHQKSRQDNAVEEGNEKLLPKCYQTEDTPYVISNVASITDLRPVPASNKIEENDLPFDIDNSEITSTSGSTQIRTLKFSRTNPHQSTQLSSNPYDSGSYTPEKTVYYCEEGTPGYFSRYDSLSSLDEAPPQGENSQKDVQRKSSKTKEELHLVSKHLSDADKLNSPPELPSMVQTPQVNSALETPLMFSRQSSMDSLAEDDVEPLDDKCSVVSDFSRLASGIISPSEIPDSPTQSMPQSPRRNSGSGTASNACFSTSVSPNTQRIQNYTGENSNRCLRSVFEDDLNRFNVENTPAQFSTATSLSNLSILDEEPTNKSPLQQQSLLGTTKHLSEGEEEEADANENNHNLILVPCINMGMKRTPIPSTGMTHDESRKYCTEDTPALLSNAGSNTNLSTISICSSYNDPKEVTVYEVLGRSSGNTTHHTQSINRRSLNLSDDMSSNASESGATGIDILQQCIRDGMQKPSSQDKADIAINPMTNLMDPIAMLRRGGNLLPPFIPVNDEMNKYLVEDSPCNFSVMSALSNLTIDSNLVESAAVLQGASNITSNNADNSETINNSQSLLMTPPILDVPVEDARRSSLSIESDENTNLLSQAIAVGSNKPNLGFPYSMTSTGKHTTSLSSFQPIPINTANSTPSLTSQDTVEPINNINSPPAPMPPAMQDEDVRREPQGHDDSLSSLSIESDDDANILSQVIAAGSNKTKSNLGFPNSMTSTGKHTTSLSLFQPIPINPAALRSSMTSQVTARNADNSELINNTNSTPDSMTPATRAIKLQMTSVPEEDARREPQGHDDSLSSLSIESDDDTNILSQVIAAGSNKQKSTMAFPTSRTSTGKNTTSLSSFRPIPINTTTSTTSLISQATASNLEKLGQKPNHSKHNYRDSLQAGKELYSSEDSSDSNDNQSKSLFEHCILMGMHQNNESNLVGYSGGSTTARKHSRKVKSHRSKSEHTEHNTNQSNQNLKQFDSLSMQSVQLTLNRHDRERGSRDEKLLMECINTRIIKKINNGQITSEFVQMEEATHPINAKYSHNNTTNCSAITSNIYYHQHHSSSRRREERQPSHHSPRDFEQFATIEQQHHHQQHQSRRRHTRSQHSQPGAGSGGETNSSTRRKLSKSQERSRDYERYWL